MKPTETMALGAFQRTYGGKRGFAHHLQSLALLRFGYFRRYQVIDWTKVDRLVFVCKGNICRSPYAHAKVIASGFPATSFGLMAQPGAPANRTAILHAGFRRISLQRHKATPLYANKLRMGDLIVCMEPPQAAAVAAFEQQANLQITLLGLWSRPRRPWLVDPYGLDDGYWITCLDIIDSAVERMLQLINRRDGP